MTGNPVPADINLLAPGSAPEAEVLVLAASQGAVLLDGQTGVAATEALAAILPSLGARGSLDELVRVPAAAVGGADAPVVAVVGAGTALDTDDERDDEAALGATRPAVLARLAGRAVRGLAGTGTVVLGLPASTREELAAVAEGALTAAYAWAGRVPTDTAPVATVEILTPLAGTAEGEAVLARARALATATTLARDLVNDPPNRLTPQALAERAREVAEEAGLVYDVLDEVQLADQGFGGIVGVGQGSVHPPRLVRVEWVPEAADARSVALIGKGITFDSGGISLKPGAEMDEMKFDMCGAATVISTFCAAVKLQLPINLVAVVATCENMPSGAANKPGDVVKSMKGLTIEVLNTDAEGRLILCDALTYAEQFKPKAVIDVATLTGACIIALGHDVSGVMGNNQDLVDSLLAASRNVDDKAWQLPLFETYKDQLKSNFADIPNIGTPGAGTITAATFLSYFTEDYPWAHLDIAGTAWKSGSEKGATGRPVPLLLNYLRNVK